MTTYYRTHTIFIKKSNPLFKVVDEYAFLCKNLKNATTYAFRQAFFNEGKILNVYDLINLFTQNNQVDYRAIPSKVAQQVMIQTKQDFASFKALQQSYQEQLALSSKEPMPKCKKISKPNLPKYLDKEKGRANIIFTKQAVSKKKFEKGILSLCQFDSSRPLTFKLGKLAKVITYDDLKEVKIVKTPNGYDVKIVYEVKRPSCSQSAKAEQGKVTKKKKKDDGSKQSSKVIISHEDIERYRQLRIWSIDLGVNNLMTVANNTNERTFIILGRVLKSINQYFNKKLAKLHSKLDKAKDDFVKAAIQRRISKLYQKRKHKVNDFLHKASRYLINQAVFNKINLIVIGYNEGWKQEIDMGSVNNQKFALIPFLTLLNMIRYKAEAAGIEIVVNEESYTSKCSFLDSEELKHHNVYKGNRIHRGLFKSANACLINADVNAAFNILRKVIGNFDYDPVQACSTPKTINVLK